MFDNERLFDTQRFSVSQIKKTFEYIYGYNRLTMLLVASLISDYLPQWFRRQNQDCVTVDQNDIKASLLEFPFPDQKLYYSLMQN